MKVTKIIIAVVTLIFAGVIISACTSSTATEKKQTSQAERSAGEDTDKRGTKLGETAPDFELASVKGDKISLETLKGNPAVLVFWSYYCPSCEEEAPHINKLNDEFASKGVKVIGINVGESKTRIEGGIRDFGIKYTVAGDEGSKVTKSFGVIGTPTVIFLDENGVVKYNGNKLPEDYAKRLATLVS